MSAPNQGDAREKALAAFRKKLLEHKEADAKVRQRTLKFRFCNASNGINDTDNDDILAILVRQEMKQLKADYDKSEDDLKALQSVGQIVGEVLRRLDDERCTQFYFIESSGNLGDAPRNFLLFFTSIYFSVLPLAFHPTKCIYPIGGGF
jgi:ATP-dependent 26S proteasome regulatory subunit